MLDRLPFSMDMIASVFDNSTDCVKLLSDSGALLWMNRGGLCAMELASFDLVRGREWAGFWPVEMAEQIRATYRDSAEARHLTAACPTARGTPKWWDITVVPLRHGAETFYLATSRDVTERERLRQTREVLLEEMRHRQGNTLALAGTLMQAHAASHPEAATFINDMSIRLAALGRAQNVVGAREGSDEDICLHNLTNMLIRPLLGPDCALRIDIPKRVILPQDCLDMVAVVLSELAVNSTKYGALCGGGEVAISARQRVGMLNLAWCEAAQAPVSRCSREGGSGLRLMRRIAAVNGAGFELSWKRYGPEVRLSIPVRARSAA